MGWPRRFQFPVRRVCSALREQRTCGQSFVSGPVFRALKGSYLAAAIRGGTQAISGDKRKHIEESVRPEFVDSLNLDEATRERHPNDARWDYLLGHAACSRVVALETHSAETSQVSKVIQKRTASLRHLQDQLAPGHQVAEWYWVASGRVDFVPHEKTMLRLSENGIRFVGGRLEARHLAGLSKQTAQQPTRRHNPRK
jgi:hypothetical protein